jgi:hypothetical protein
MNELFPFLKLDGHLVGMFSGHHKDDTVSETINVLLKSLIVGDY